MEGEAQKMSFFEECMKLIERRINGNFVDFVRDCIRKMVLYNGGWKKEDIDELTSEFFLKKLNTICTKFLKGNIEKPRAFIWTVVENFCKGKSRRLKMESLDAQVVSVHDDSDGTEFTELISAEEDEITRIYIDSLANELLDELYKLCKDKRTDMIRYICFLISSHYYKVDDFRDPSWSQSNVYKIVERTRKFLSEFQNEYSVEDKVLGRVLELFYETYCQKNGI